MMSDREVVLAQVLLSMVAVLAIQRWRQWAGTIVLVLLAALYVAQGLEAGEDLGSYVDDVVFFAGLAVVGHALSWAWSRLRARREATNRRR